MSDIPSLSFSNLDECLKLGGYVGDYSLPSENEFSFDSDMHVYKDNYEESVNLFQEESLNLKDNFLSDNFNISEKSHFSSDSYCNFDENVLPLEEPLENSSPSSFVKSIVDWSNCENYIEPDTDFEYLTKELFSLNTPSELSEQLNKEDSEKIFKDITESTDSIKDKKVLTTENPVTVILKKIKSTPNNLNMVAPINIPKTTYTLVRVSGKNTLTNTPEKVSVLNLNRNIILSKKNETYSNLKPQKDLDLKVSPISLNEKLKEEIKEKAINSHKSNGFSEYVNYNELPFTSLKRKHPNLSEPKHQKKKAYELAPLPDPTLERCRKNAVNAKKNREIKKQKMMKLEAEVEQERQEKFKLASENETLKQMNEKLKERINLLLTALESSEPTLENMINFQKVQEFLDKSNASSTLHPNVHSKMG